MTASQRIMEETEQYVLHTYNRFPVVFERGEGVHLYDVEGKMPSDERAEHYREMYRMSGTVREGDPHSLTGEEMCAQLIYHYDRRGEDTMSASEFSSACEEIRNELLHSEG